MPNTKKEQWVLEWSQKSNNLHVRPLAQLMGFNQARFALNAKTPGDYITLTVGTYDEVTAAADRIRPKVIEREQTRTAAVQPEFISIAANHGSVQ